MKREYEVLRWEVAYILLAVLLFTLLFTGADRRERYEATYNSHELGGWTR